MSDVPQQPETEPEDFLSFARRGHVFIKMAWDNLQMGKLEAQLTSREQLIAWDEDAKRAEELRFFLASDFWNKRLEPMLRAKTTIQPWRPGGPATLDQATTQYLVVSGKSEAFLEVLSEFREWERKGVEGARRLRLEREKNAEIEKRRQSLTGARL